VRAAHHVRELHRVRGGALAQLPAQRLLRQLLLRHVDGSVPPGLGVPLTTRGGWAVQRDRGLLGPSPRGCLPGSMRSTAAA
jgi:hypothetical protein